MLTFNNGIRLAASEHMYKRAGGLSVFTFLIFQIGCGGTEGLGKVNGVVMLDGKPLVDASVEFSPVDGKGLTSYGRTDSNGAYYMMATRTENGAAVGANKVRITTYEVIDMNRRTPEQVPTKYNTATELVREVKSGTNKFDFDLSTEGGKVINRKNDPSNQ